MTNVTHSSLLCIYFFIFKSLHVSSTSCLSSGETNCVNTASGNCHSVSVAVSCARRKFVNFRPINFILSFILPPLYPHLVLRISFSLPPFCYLSLHHSAASSLAFRNPVFWNTGSSYGSNKTSVTATTDPTWRGPSSVWSPILPNVEYGGRMFLRNVWNTASQITCVSAATWHVVTPLMH